MGARLRWYVPMGADGPRLFDNRTTTRLRSESSEFQRRSFTEPGPRTDLVTRDPGDTRGCNDRCVTVASSAGIGPGRIAVSINDFGRRRSCRRYEPRSAPTEAQKSSWRWLVRTPPPRSPCAGHRACSRRHIPCAQPTSRLLPSKRAISLTLARRPPRSPPGTRRATSGPDVDQAPRPAPPGALAPPVDRAATVERGTLRSIPGHRRASTGPASAETGHPRPLIPGTARRSRRGRGGTRGQHAKDRLTGRARERQR